MSKEDKTPKAAITAKVVVTRHHATPEGSAPEQVVVDLAADYEGNRNQAWSVYTPRLNMTMVVKPEVAEHFQAGKSFTLTFTPDED